ncbi:lipopolysaccharide biosynthesis protein [Janibacter corallicola]|uniref:lipopolysaccharide biosynthesis protein n=1 Tax=Janibacter corallicola TaxID=415212 RepID=UPI0008340009|nr:lipopolysaccharide biosynthesis protein [Janibacter corallicola]
MTIADGQGPVRESAVGGSGAEGRSLRRAARGSILTLTGSAVAAVAGFALTLAITRLSSQDQAGLFFSATSLFLLAIGLARLGTQTSLVYFISRGRSRGRPDLARPYMRTAALPVLLVSVLVGLGLFVGAEALGRWLSPEMSADFARWMRVLAVAVPVAAVANLALAGTQGLGTMKALALVEQVGRPLGQLLLVGVVLVWLGDPGLLPTAWAIVYVPVAAIAWWWWHRLARPAPTEDVGATVRSLTRPFWAFSTPRALAAVTQTAMQRFDIVLVGALAGLAEAAIYTAATRFLVLGQIAGRALSLSIQPLLGEALARHDRAVARSLYQVVTAWLVLGTWPLYLVFINHASWALEIFGDGYSEAAPALVLLSCVMLVATACGMVDMVLNMAGRSLWNLLNVVVAFGVNLGLDLWLIPQWGFMGAAIGWAAAITTNNLLPLAQVAREPGIHPFGRQTLSAMGTATLLFGVLPAVASAVAGNGHGVSLAVLCLAAALYAVALVLARRHWHLTLLVTAVRRRRRSRREGPPGT